MEQDTHQYTGGPTSSTERVRVWLTPTGGTVFDGLRLAVINAGVLIAGFVLLGFLSLLDRLADWLLPVSLLFPAFFVLLIVAAAGLWVSHRYAEMHAQATRARAVAVKPDLFAIIGALPYVVLAVMLLGSGMLSLFLAMVTFSGSRFVDALGQIGYGALFTALSAGVIYVVRMATD